MEEEGNSSNLIKRAAVSGFCRLEIDRLMLGSFKAWSLSITPPPTRCPPEGMRADLHARTALVCVAAVQIICGALLSGLSGRKHEALIDLSQCEAEEEVLPSMFRNIAVYSCSCSEKQGF